jgi:hypothetical protein
MLLKTVKYVIYTFRSMSKLTKSLFVAHQLRVLPNKIAIF